MKSPHLPQALVASVLLLVTACDSEDSQPLELLDVINELDGATTGEVAPVLLDEDLEDELELVSLVEFPEEESPQEEPARDLGDFDIAAEVAPQLAGALGYWSWGTSGNNGARHYLGSASNRTCFLQGVTGELESDPSSPLEARAGVYIDSTSNQWYVETRAGVPTFWGEGGDGVMAHVTCIPNTSNRQHISWGGNAAGTYDTLYAYAEDHGTTKCFMTAVSGSVGWASPSAWSGLRRGTRNGEPTWELDGHLVEKSSGGSGGGSAAVCVDIPFQSTSSYSWQAPSTAASTQLTSSTNGLTCAVHTLRGNFAANNFGWSDGVRIFPVSTSTGDRWSLVGTSSKKIKGECYKNFTFWPSWP